MVKKSIHFFTDKNRILATISLFFVILFFCSASFSQNYLLFNKNQYRHAIYNVGDDVSFRTTGSRKKISGKIVAISDSAIIFNSFSVAPKDVSNIYVDAKTKVWFVFRYKYEVVLPIIGAGYILIDAVNTDRFDSQTLVVGLALIGAGMLARIIIPRTIAINDRHKLVIIRRADP